VAGAAAYEAEGVGEVALRLVGAFTGKVPRLLAVAALCLLHALPLPRLPLVLRGVAAQVELKSNS
jgi:hypothetical protein